MKQSRKLTAKSDRSAYHRKYHQENKESIAARRRKYYRENKEAFVEYSQKYRQENKESLSSYDRDYRRRRKIVDPQFCITINLRSRLWHAIKNHQKTGSAVSDLGCSINDLKRRLEFCFEPGMTWENYGKWHIDHIKPLSKFDLTDRDQFLQANNFTNLQPMWAEDNLRKGTNDY